VFGRWRFQNQVGEFGKQKTEHAAFTLTDPLEPSEEFCSSIMHECKSRYG